MKNKKSQPIKQTAEKGSTLFLRAAIIGLAVIVLGLCVLILPPIYSSWGTELADLQPTKYPILFGLSAVAIAFWFALYQGWKILNYIDTSQAFSTLSVDALKTMKIFSFAISGLFVAGWPVIFLLAQHDDAPGLIIIYGIIFVGIPFVFAVAIGVLQQLLKNAIDIKSENDLTV